MDFQNRTKQALAESIKALMTAKPLDKITVREIAEHCGTTRATFYRNFKDKYDLVNWYFDLIVQKTIKQMGISLTLQEALIQKFTYMLEDRTFFISAFSSIDYNNLMDYDYKCISEFYHSVAHANGKVTDEIHFLLEFYCHGSMEMTAHWVKEGMKRSPEEMARLLEEAMPKRLIPYLSPLFRGRPSV